MPALLFQFRQIRDEKNSATVEFSAAYSFKLCAMRLFIFTIHTRWLSDPFVHLSDPKQINLDCVRNRNIRVKLRGPF